jgi:hypothetical protein
LIEQFKFQLEVVTVARIGRHDLEIAERTPTGIIRMNASHGDAMMEPGIMAS